MSTKSRNKEDFRRFDVLWQIHTRRWMRKLSGEEHDRNRIQDGGFTNMLI